VADRRFSTTALPAAWVGGDNLLKDSSTLAPALPLRRLVSTPGTDLHRRARLGPVDSLALGHLSKLNTIARADGFRYSLTMSTSVSSNRASLPV
jgi:hypothetical protein